MIATLEKFLDICPRDDEQLQKFYEYLPDDCKNISIVLTVVRKKESWSILLFLLTHFATFHTVTNNSKEGLTISRAVFLLSFTIDMAYVL